MKEIKLLTFCTYNRYCAPQDFFNSSFMMVNKYPTSLLKICLCLLATLVFIMRTCPNLKSLVSSTVPSLCERKELILTYPHICIYFLWTSLKGLPDTFELYWGLLILIPLILVATITFFSLSSCRFLGIQSASLFGEYHIIGINHKKIISVPIQCSYLPRGSLY